MLVGRRAERAALQALVDGAVRGCGGALLVTGEPGMGKTVLLDDLTADRTDVTALRASGRESDADLPFATLAELLRPAEREIDALPAPQARALRGARAREGRRGVDGLAVGVATLGVLAALALRQPVLAVVDDLQWVDEPSRRRSRSLRGVCRRFTSRSCAPDARASYPETCERHASLALSRLRRAGRRRAARRLRSRAARSRRSGEAARAVGGQPARARRASDRALRRTACRATNSESRSP